MAAEEEPGFISQHKVEIGALSAVGMLALIWGGKKVIDNILGEPEQSGGTPGDEQTHPLFGDESGRDYPELG